MKKKPLTLTFPAGLRDSGRRRAYADAVFMSIGDGAIVTNKEGKIAQINEAALRIMGLTEAEVMGKWFHKIMIAKDENGNNIDLLSRPITKAVVSGEPVSARMFYATKNRGNIPVYVTVSPIIFNGKPNGAVEVFRDITAEEEIDRLKSEFISLASHQLRTPLTAINTYAHMLVQGYKGDINEGQREFLDTILASTDRMNNLIDTLLSVSRLESGNITMNPTDVHIDKLLQDIKQELWPLAKSKKQALTVTASDDCIVHSDRLLLTEVCANLMSNAVKYTPIGGTVEVTAKKSLDEVIITVKDDGYGIPEELQGRVFTKFFRAPNILHEEAVGTGLGLYLVKQIVERNLDGMIDFVSQEGKGTTFTVKLPLEVRGAVQTIIKFG